MDLCVRWQQLFVNLVILRLLGSPACLWSPAQGRFVEDQVVGGAELAATSTINPGRRSVQSAGADCSALGKGKMGHL